MDKKMLMVFYTYAKENRAFGRFTELACRYSAPLFFAIYYAGGVRLILHDKTALLYYLGVPCIQLVFCSALRRLFKRSRPYAALGLTPPKDKEKMIAMGRDGFSFPSNHSSSSGIIAFACMYVNTAFGVCVFLLAVAAGISRVSSAAHYPSDVAAGFLISAVFAIVGFNLLPLLSA